MFLFFIITVPIMSAQDDCGFDPDIQDVSDIQNFILGLQPQNSNQQQNCSDTEWNGGDVYYRMVIEYTDLTPIETITPAVEYAKNFYEKYGIFINVMYVRNDCANCPFATSMGWGQPWNNNINFPNCIYGRIASQCNTIGFRTVCGNGDLGKGNFFVVLPNSLGNQNMVHELGHALGLFHTFDSFSENLHEKVEPTSNCSCNCLTHGDRICETKTDPYIQGDAGNWNQNMFDYNNKSIKNLDNKVDICNTPYDDIPNQSKLFFNIMSYHYNSSLTFDDIVFESGQVSLIKHWNDSKPWNVDTQTDYTIIPGFDVDSKVEITNKNYTITSDIIVKSKLILKNCNFKFTNNSKIKILNKGDLSIDNTSLEKYASDNSSCLNISNDQWSGISVETDTYFPTIHISNNSVVSGATGATIKTGNNSKLKLYILSNSTIEGNQVLDMKSKALFAFISDSNINGNFVTQNGPGHVMFANTQIHSFLIQGKNVSFSRNSNLKNGGLYISGGGLGFYVSNSVIGQNIDFRSDGNINFSNNIFRPYFGATTGVNIYDYPKLVIRDNEFELASSTINFRNNIDPQFSNLIFKNDFIETSGNNVRIFNDNSKLHIECNEFQNASLNTDLNIIARIADMQGDNRLSAGNFFSRTNPEIIYTPASRLNYHFKNPGTKEEPIYISGGGDFRKINNSSSDESKCNVSYPPMPDLNPAHCFNGIKDGNEFDVDCGGSCLVSCPQIMVGGIGVTPNYPAHCNNGILDGNESGVDCGGSCPPCFTNHCNDNIMNGDETGVDCGGANCPPCNVDYCSDGIENNGETGIDCGGTCPPCFTSTCNDGIMNGTETGIDCGGNCPSCPHSCFDGVQNGNETSVDCGGGCPPCSGNCYDGIQNNGEYFIDCGGPCSPCVFDDYVVPQDIEYTDFINELNSIYGTDTIPQGSDIEIDTEVNYLNSLYDNGNTTGMVTMIEAQSTSNPSAVIDSLQSASPFVSPKAFHTLFKYSQYYTETQVADILALNPGAMEDLYIYYIVYKSESFTTSTKQNLLSSVQVADTRTGLNNKIGIKKIYMDYMIHQRILFQQQMIKADFNKVRAQYLKNHDNDVPYFVYHSYTNEGKYNHAWNYLNSIDTNDISDPYYKSQLVKLLEMEAILMDHYYAGNRIVNMPSNKRQILINIAESNHGLATMKARIILGDMYSMTFGDFPDNLHYKPLTFLTNSEPRTKLQTQIKVAPNPATTELKLTLGNFDKVSGGNGDVVIYDLEGKIVLKTNIITGISVIDIKSLTAGMYIYKVNLDIGGSYQGKFFKID